MHRRCLRGLTAIFLLIAAFITSNNVAAQAATPTPTTASAASVQTGDAKQGSTQGTTGTTSPTTTSPQPKTIPMNAISTVKDNIAVEAGLLTSASASQLFGGWVAEHFLVVQVTIGNQSRDQQFVLHDVFLDYSDWKLSGIYGNAATVSSENAHPLQDF